MDLRRVQRERREIHLEKRARIDRDRRSIEGALLPAILALAAVAAVQGCAGNTSPPPVSQQAEEVAALEAHVLPVVKELRATWFLDEFPASDSIHWSRGEFNRDAARARQDGHQVFDRETEIAFEQMAQAIRASGVPTYRLFDAKFAEDGSVRSASFNRNGGGIEHYFMYRYSPGARPPEWTSPLGPVVLTRIGETDWWFEQSPDD